MVLSPARPGLAGARAARPTRVESVTDTIFKRAAKVIVIDAGIRGWSRHFLDVVPIPFPAVGLFPIPDVVPVEMGPVLKASPLTPTPELVPRAGAPTP